MPNVTFSAGAYQKKAESVIARLTKKRKPILIEGGTGLYIKALLYGLWEGPAKNPVLRQTLIAQKGDALYQKLIEVDPVSAHKIHFNDRYKIGRALEVFYATGRSISSFHAEHRFSSGSQRSFCIIGLRRDRTDLFRRIDARIDQQFKKGLISETRRQIAKGLSLELPSMRTLGVRHIIAYLQGKQTLETTVSLLKRDTRHYAKRQMTWFSADPNISWIDLKEEESPEEIFARILPLLHREQNGSIPKDS
ncbi:MAG: tRNA (adenosine(37)-N6)-dimethylallyltransferase MiaA [Nitrospirae bacterium]|nr:tRNA (adenosine(37)-N6)-dimethylallyltransferase MiaA [Candidatus Troglogloeales bacterium]